MAHDQRRDFAVSATLKRVVDEGKAAYDCVLSTLVSILAVAIFTGPSSIFSPPSSDSSFPPVSIVPSAPFEPPVLIPKYFKEPPHDQPVSLPVSMTTSVSSVCLSVPGGCVFSITNFSGVLFLALIFSEESFRSVFVLIASASRFSRSERALIR